MTQIVQTSVPSGISTAMAAGLARLWVKFSPEIEQRLSMLEATVDALAADALAEEQRQTAHSSAHKLAGILGTFGLQNGTELARQSELLLEEGVCAADADQLSTWVEELRALFNERQKASQ